MLSNKKLVILSFFLFLIFNIGLFSIIFSGNHLIPLNLTYYKTTSIHFRMDPRFDNFNKLDVIRRMSVFDAEWYLRIAQNGYPFRPNDLSTGLIYNFFPLYPIVLKSSNFIFSNIELCATSVMLLLLVTNFFSLYYIITKIFSETIAIKTSFLFWFFPFSIVYRSFFTEGLYLFFLIWFVYFFIKNKFLLAAFLLGLMNITKGNGFLLFFPLFYFFIRQSGNLKIGKILTIIFLTFSPLILWEIYCLINTGSPFYFFYARSAWVTPGIPFSTIYYSFHHSALEAFFVPIFFVLFILSKSILPFRVWLIALCILLVPLLTFTLPFSRSQMISFPLFIYPAMKLKGWIFGLTIAMELVALFVVSLYFVNWYWIS